MKIYPIGWWIHEAPNHEGDDDSIWFFNDMVWPYIVYSFIHDFDVVAGWLVSALHANWNGFPLVVELENCITWRLEFWNEVSYGPMGCITWLGMTYSNVCMICICMFTSCHTVAFAFCSYSNPCDNLCMLYDFKNTEISHFHQSHNSTIAASPHVLYNIEITIIRKRIGSPPPTKGSLDGICFFDMCHTFQPIKSQGIARNSCQRAMK